jgi:hypothetical protein
MTKNNHIYTLNHNLKQLQQSLEEEDKKIISVASSNYYIREIRNTIII